jgi:O-antigen/teichoic acid export membrane protein
VALLVKLAAMASLVPLWGLEAVALSTGLMYAVSCLGLWWAANEIVKRSAREKP